MAGTTRCVYDRWTHQEDTEVNKKTVTSFLLNIIISWLSITRCLLHLRWVFLPQLTPARKSLTGKDRSKPNLDYFSQVCFMGDSISCQAEIQYEPSHPCITKIGDSCAIIHRNISIHHLVHRVRPVPRVRGFLIFK